jgi:UDP-N-acetyl-D-mannosaminuronate dehydrogenase
LAKNIAVFGLGYVGLPLCIEAIKSDYKVFGVDVNL